MKQISIHEAVHYEIRASWWAQYMWAHWMQVLSGKYFAWKANRKYIRYNDSIEMEDRVMEREGLSE